MLGIVILNFFLLRLAPGDAADVLAGEAGSVTVETMAALRERFGLDLSALDQLLSYLNNLAHFSLGQSPRYNMPVASLTTSQFIQTCQSLGRLANPVRQRRRNRSPCLNSEQEGSQPLSQRFFVRG